TAGLLDLDDLGTEVREQEGAIGAGQEAGEVEEPEAGERFRHGPDYRVRARLRRISPDAPLTRSKPRVARAALSDGGRTSAAGPAQPPGCLSTPRRWRSERLG